MDGLTFVALTEAGATTARRLQAVLGGELHGRQGRVAAAETHFLETTAQLRDLFAAGRPLVALCAAGVAVRALAPLLGDKRAEPPVVVVAEDGSAVVPLLGGHHGGNALARRIGEVLGVPAAVTTAGDLRFGVALDEPPAGWTLANPEDAKDAAAALLAGGSARIDGNLPWLQGAGLPLDEAGAVTLAASLSAADTGTPRRLVYRPQVLALGVGCARGCPPEELAALVRESLAAADLAPEAVALVASLDLKADEPAVLQVAAALGRPARFFEAAALEAETPRLANPSDVVFAEVGCHGVAEAAALAACGAAGALLVEKRKSANATCAVACAPSPLDPHSIGRPRGRLSIVGIGPGTPDWRTPEAERLLAEATDLVAYGLYLDILGTPKPHQRHHRFDLGDEEARAEAALRLAAQGRDVALVSSGDAGIYAMAAVVFELLDRHAGGGGWWDAARRVEVAVTPGISALQAAAARLGAPLGHDFCAISLSDLLTPWETIRRRVEAAAAGDFVVAFYNPVSRKRDWQLAEARDLLLAGRPAETPVALASNLGRPTESLRLTTLGALDPAEVDMLTLVLVGSSQTRAVPRGDGQKWVYTPRGYAAKHGTAALRNASARAAVAGGPAGTERRPPAAVHFIGAGPGAPDLITLRGLRLIERCPVCLYAGSLVPAEVVAAAPEGARVLDTASMTLDAIVAEIQTAHAAGLEVARVHSGDPSLYGAIAEQIRRLKELGIPYDIVPGVPAYAAAAAALGRELTLPDVSQTVILTRTAMKSSGMPPGEELETLGRSGATLAIHLSVRNLRHIEEALTPHYGADCPVVVAYRVGWPDEFFLHGTLADIRGKVRAAKLTRTALILVGRVLGEQDFRDSALYDPQHAHVLRPVRG